VELGVGDLPEQEVGDPELVGGPDEQVDVGHVGRVQVPGDGPLVDAAGAAALADLGRQGLDGPGELVAAAVVQGHGQGHAGVAGGQVLGLLDAPADVRGGCGRGGR
jgi:hypothetical protein